MLVAGYFVHKYCAPVVIAQRKISLKLKGAPILSHFSETIKGIKTIHSYNLQTRMKSKVTQLIMASTKASISCFETLVTYYTYNRHILNII